MPEEFSCTVTLTDVDPKTQVPITLSNVNPKIQSSINRQVKVNANLVGNEGVYKKSYIPTKLDCYEVNDLVQTLGATYPGSYLSAPYPASGLEAKGRHILQGLREDILRELASRALGDLFEEAGINYIGALKFQDMPDKPDGEVGRMSLIVIYEMQQKSGTEILKVPLVEFIREALRVSRQEEKIETIQGLGYNKIALSCDEDKERLRILPYKPPINIGTEELTSFSAGDIKTTIDALRAANK